MSHTHILYMMPAHTNSSYLKNSYCIIYQIMAQAFILLQQKSQNKIMEII